MLFTPLCLQGFPLGADMAAWSPQLSPWSAGSSPLCAMSCSHTERLVCEPWWSPGGCGPSSPGLCPRLCPLCPSWGVPAANCEPMASRAGGQETDTTFHKEFRYWNWIKKREKSANRYVINLKRELTDGKCWGFKPQGIFSSAYDTALVQAL